MVIWSLRYVLPSLPPPSLWLRLTTSSKQVLPAAQPSFLQEVVILDHDPALIPRPPGTLLFPTKPAESSSPTRSILTMGQTGKKFIVVPEVKHLLGCIEKQEKEEKREKEKLKAALLAKKEEA